MPPLSVRPLVMRCGAFGDIVLLTVLIRQLHARFGQPVDVIAAGPWTRPLLEGQPGVGEIVLVRGRKMPYWLSAEQRRLVHWLRRRGAGPTWYLDLGSARDLIARGGIPDEYVCDSRAYPWLPGETFAERYIRLSRFTPASLADRIPPPGRDVEPAAHLVLSAESRAALDPWLVRRGLSGRRLIVMQAGNRRTARGWSRRRSTNTKYWPEERWAQVIRAVRDHRPGHAILLLGVGNEYDLNEDIIRLAGAPDVYNVADDLPITTLLPLLERSESMIAVDTGPAHAAAALGCPTVALFGAADPFLYRPGGATTPTVAVTGEVAGAQSILGITVEAVVSAWIELLREGAASSDSVKSVSPVQTGR